MSFRFVAESTGHQRSSRLLSMKSANALLELSPSGKLIPAGTSVPAIVISDIMGISGSSSFHSVELKDNRQGIISENVSEALDSAYRVAILTVSDTVALGKGPDRRYFNKFDWHSYLLLILNHTLYVYLIP